MRSGARVGAGAWGWAWGVAVGDRLGLRLLFTIVPVYKSITVVSYVSVKPYATHERDHHRALTARRERRTDGWDTALRSGAAPTAHAVGHNSSRAESARTRPSTRVATRHATRYRVTGRQYEPRTVRAIRD